MDKRYERRGMNNNYERRNEQERMNENSRGI